MSPCTCCGTAPVALLADTFGVSRQAIYAERAKARAVTTGEPPSTAPGAPCQSPLPARKEPRGVPADELAAAINAVVEEFPAWGVRKVWATLRRKGLRVSRRRVHALMSAAGLVLPRASDELWAPETLSRDDPESLAGTRPAAAPGPR
jgi:hypothetical protein